MGGVNSITGTAPIVVTFTSGTPIVSLQGTAGGVFYGTGGGSNITSAGTSGQYLMSKRCGCTYMVTYLFISMSNAPEITLRCLHLPLRQLLNFLPHLHHVVVVTGNNVTIGSTPTARNIPGYPYQQMFIPPGQLLARKLPLPTETPFLGNQTHVPLCIYFLDFTGLPQAVVTIAASTTYNIQVAAHAGSITLGSECYYYGYTGELIIA